MSALAPITLNDGQATPVAHTFNPVSRVGNFVTYRENGVGLPFDAERVITTDLKTTQNAHTVTLKVYVPYLEEISGQTPGGYVAAPKLAYFEQSVHVFNVPRRGSELERKDILAFAEGLLSEPQIVELITKLTAQLS